MNKGRESCAIWERAFQADGAAQEKALTWEHGCVQAMVGRVVRMEWVRGRGEVEEGTQRVRS